MAIVGQFVLFISPNSFGCQYLIWLRTWLPPSVGTACMPVGRGSAGRDGRIGLQKFVAFFTAIVVLFTATLHKEASEYRTLINKFHRMRQKRHKFVYEIEGTISRTEAKDSIESAKRLTEGIFRITKEKARDLFKR